MSPRRRNARTTRLAMLGGLLLGFALLYALRPQVPQSAPTRTVTIPPAPSTPPAMKPSPHRPAAPPPLAPADEPQEDEEVLVEPVDTGEIEWALAEIEVRFEDADGYVVDDARGGLSGCQVESFRRMDDGFAATVVAGDICQATAYRRDGLLQVRSDFLEFEAIDGLVATLVFPAGRTGGIGVQFRATEGGMLVVGVVPGTPAYLAGLQEGDLIVGVEGLDAGALDANDFIDEMTGPEGSDVEFEIEFEADTGLTRSSVVLTRAFLSG